MHFHLYRVGVSVVPATPPSPHPIPFKEHNPQTLYESPSYIPIVSSTLHVVPSKRFRVKCRRDGDTSDVDVTNDLSFEVFIDGVWVAGCTFQSYDSETLNLSKPCVRILRISRPNSE